MAKAKAKEAGSGAWKLWLVVGLFIWWQCHGYLVMHKVFKTWGPETSALIDQGYRPGPDGVLYGPDPWRIVDGDGFAHGSIKLSDPPHPDFVFHPATILPGDEERAIKRWGKGYGGLNK